MTSTMKWVLTGLGAVGAGSLGYWLYTKRPWESSAQPLAPATTSAVSPTDSATAPAPGFVAAPTSTDAALFQAARRLRVTKAAG